MRKAFQYIGSSLTELLFPKVCTICGMLLSGNQQFICGECIIERFEKAALSPEDLINLPENIDRRIALWHFDKGGYLQELLHDLKYKRLTGVGEDLGVALGARMKREKPFVFEDTALLPVPLHPRKRKTRGYNQAYHIAIGMKKVLKTEIISNSAVIRVKNTKTQTGFSLERRRENISDAFEVDEASLLEGKNIIIVDDVFTTGATSFELAGVLKKAGAQSIYIATIAQA